jgi:hypothetical protein
LSLVGTSGVGDDVSETPSCNGSEEVAEYMESFACFSLEFSDTGIVTGSVTIGFRPKQLRQLKTEDRAEGIIVVWNELKFEAANRLQ